MLNTSKIKRKKHLHDHKVDMGSQKHIGDPKNYNFRPKLPIKPNGERKAYMGSQRRNRK